MIGDPTQHLEVLVRSRKIPGGRGRNSVRHESTWSGRGWLEAYQSRSIEEAIGKAVMGYYAAGHAPAVVFVHFINPAHEEQKLGPQPRA